jgi:hypothetical protein
MMPTLAGMTVARKIPTATLAGLAMGRYALHGGVVRWAAGTARAGQIVAHLLPAAGLASPLLAGAGIVTGIASVGGLIASGIGAGFSIANFYQNKKIFKAVEQVMQVAELNLAVTRAGFAELDARLAALNETLWGVKAALTSIQRLLESTQRAELQAALDNLEKLPAIRDERVRIEFLTHSANVLAKLRRVYYDQMLDAGSVSGGLGAEEYFLIAALGQVRCYAELREPIMAHQVMSDIICDWRTWARSFAQVRLLGNNPERFLYGDLASHAPLMLVSAWLDFASGEHEGLTAVEALRTKIEPWYYHRSQDGEPRNPRRSDMIAARDEKLARDRNRLIPALNKLVTRDAVLQSHAAQYTLMAEHNLTSGELEATFEALAPAEAGGDTGILVVMCNQLVG